MDFLPQYARVFDTVEGNSTFYALPSPAAVARWRAETPDGFHFCFKFPSQITHRMMLRNARVPTDAFLQLMAPMGDRLGPFMLQLGPRFGPQQLDTLRSYLRSLSSEFCYSVEVRHPKFFEQGPDEAALNDLLRQASCDRVLFDTRCMHATQAADQSTREAQARKPALPVRALATSRSPLVRFVAQNHIEAAAPYLDAWAPQLADWLAQGLSPYLFAHTPDDRAAPELARQLHQRVSLLVPELKPLPGFAGEAQGPRADQGDGQLSLFEPKR